MVDQVVPITDIASAGVIKDIPSISLPPNAYSDVENIRFHDGAAWKMEGELDLELTIPALRTVDYALYWKGPTNEYYVVILDNGNILTHLITDGVPAKVGLSAGTMSGTDPVWQHTLFNGGFNLIINNGVDVPTYLSDPVGSSNIAPLPNWDSYLAQEEVTTVVWDEFNADIVLGRSVDFDTESILYSVTPRDTSIGILNFVQDLATDTLPYTLNIDDADNYFITPRARTETQTGALPGDLITISIRTDASITVRAGVIRAYGNLLMAGDLTEMDGTDVVRRLPGTIRTSDVAAPGAVPLNWNPFRNGANTADEFILSSTGVVQDMAELQGVMYVYTDVSIHGIQSTGNEVIPFQISTVTDSYGANSLGAVMEFDGRHLVVGSQDIYVFAGHPGSITSIADKRVRHYAYDNVGDDGVDTDNVRMVRNQKYDEIWIFTPKGNEEMLVWNYRSQAWMIRDQTAVVSGTQGIDSPLFTTTTQVFEGDKTFTDVDDNGYESFVARMRLGLTPEFDTETLGSTAMMTTGDVDLTITMRGSNRPNDTDPLVVGTNASDFMFIAEDDYKVDTRIHGRFINYKISDSEAEDKWNMTGYQLEIMKGGKR